MRARIKTINDNGTFREVKGCNGAIWKDFGVKVSSSGSMASIHRAIGRKMRCDRRSYDFQKAVVC
ncbi:MAG: hypothetical protein MR717_09030 [Prevotella sp.]|nr:hypothetical protein [Prevotella sp.]